MERWLQRLGYAAQWLGDTLQTAAHAAAEQTGELAEDLTDAVRDGAEEMEEHARSLPDLGEAGGLLAATAGGWLATRLLAEQEVRWGRAVFAGVIGTLVYDATMLLDQRLLGRNFDTIRPLGAAFSDDPDTQRWAGWAAHYAAGVGLALFYARYLSRLPGPPALKGAAFGLADVATLTWGGLYPLLNQVAPHIRVPPGYAGLAHAPAFTAQSALRHVAYGAGMASAYGE